MDIHNVKELSNDEYTRGGVLNVRLPMSQSSRTSARKVS